MRRFGPSFSGMKVLANPFTQFKPCSLIAKFMIARMDENARRTLLDDSPRSNTWRKYLCFSLCAILSKVIKKYAFVVSL